MTGKTDVYDLDDLNNYFISKGCRKTPEQLSHFAFRNPFDFFPSSALVSVDLIELLLKFSRSLKVILLAFLLDFLP